MRIRKTAESAVEELKKRRVSASSAVKVLVIGLLAAGALALPLTAAISALCGAASGALGMGG